VEERVKKSQTIEQLEEIIDKLLIEILEQAKKNLISDYNNEEENQMINSSSDIIGLTKVVQEIKEQQTIENNLRKKIVDELQSKLDELGLSKEDLDKEYVMSKYKGEYFSFSRLRSSFSDNRPPSPAFEEKFGKRGDDLKTI